MYVDKSSPFFSDLKKENIVLTDRHMKTLDKSPFCMLIKGIWMNKIEDRRYDLPIEMIMQCYDKKKRKNLRLVGSCYHSLRPIYLVWCLVMRSWR